MARRSKKMSGPASKLPQFQGREVKGMSVAFRKAGDGLSDKLKLDPTPHDSGDEVYHILRSVVGDINHKPIALLHDSPFERIENYVVQEAVEVDGDDVQSYLDMSREAIETARQEAKEREEEAQLAGGQGKQGRAVDPATNEVTSEGMPGEGEPDGDAE